MRGQRLRGLYQGRSRFNAINPTVARTFKEQVVQDEANANEITTGGSTIELENGTVKTREEILASQGLNPDGTPIEK